jgi:alkylmercury lyase
MSTVKLHERDREQLTEQLVASFTSFPETFRRLIVPALRELAGGQPVQPERLATHAGLPLEQTIALLRESGGEWDPSGKLLVGLGLTSVPTPHRFEVGGHTLWTWCAVDSLLFPVAIGAPARLSSPDATTGDPVRIDLTPTGVQRVEPAGAVVSIVTSRVDLAQIRPAICGNQNFYRSPATAAPWLAAHPDGHLLPVADTFEVYRRVALRVWPELGD